MPWQRLREDEKRGESEIDRQQVYVKLDALTVR